MSETPSVPSSTGRRARKPTNYSLSAAFSSLAGSDAEPDEDLIPDDDSSADENFNPPEPAEPKDLSAPLTEGSDFDEEADDDLDPSELGSGSEGEPATPSTRKKTPAKGKNKHTPDPNRKGARKPSSRSSDPAPKTVNNVEMPDADLAEGEEDKTPRLRKARQPRAKTNDPKFQDPTVRLTYNPFYQRAQGRRDKMSQLYGTAQKTIVKGVSVRDRQMHVPAVVTKKSVKETPWMDCEEEPEGSEDEEEKVWEQGLEKEMGEGGQQARWCELKEAEDHLAHGKGELKVLVGPVGEQKVLRFPRFAVQNLDQVGAGDRNGTLINIDGIVTGMEWAPRRPEGTQYLAITTNTFDVLNKADELGHDRPVSYDRRPGKSAIQIWRFPVDDSGKIGKPSLAIMLCHPWGVAREVKWCPMYKPASSTPNMPMDLGYIAAVFGDGNARVLHVTLPDDDSDHNDCCNFQLFKEAAYTLTLPSPITNLTFISATSIACSTVTGFLGTFPLCATLTSHPDPLTLIPIHQTYITHLQSCFPSYPNYIISNSLDGFSRLTNLLDPDGDYLTTARSRLAPTGITWVDSLHSSVTCEEASMIKTFPLRRFYSATTISSHSGVVRDIVGSRCHGCVLSAGSEGQCNFANPTRRLFHSKVKNYQQAWFLLEWSEKAGLARMTDGWRLIETEHSSAAAARRKDIGLQVLMAVYPREVSVDKVAWNENERFGGWATAATGCGLVRVEDVTWGSSEE